MPRSGGTYTLPAGNPVVTGTTISSTTTNNTFSDIASALTQSVSKDGQTTMTGNLPMGGFKLTGLANGSAASDSATIGQIAANTGSYVATVAGTGDAITLTPSPAITAYAAGQRFSFITSAANTTNVTVNISGLGAKAVTKYGTTALAANDIAGSGILVTIEYDGTQFQIMDFAKIAIQNGDNTFSGSNVFSCLNRSGATTSITNSTTETTLFTYTVPANTLGTTKSIRLVSPLQAINTTGGAVNLTVRVKFGATTLFSSALSITNDANGNRLTLEAVINAKNATNAQIATCRVASHSATADGTAGAVTEQSATYYGLAEDTTAAKALVITVQWASASASATAYCHNSTVEVI